MDIIDHLVVKMRGEELFNIKGGTAINSTMLNAIVRAFNLSLELGRMLGSYIRRKKDKKWCPIK